MITSPNTIGAIPAVNPEVKLGKASSAGDRWTTPTSRRRMKIAPRIGPRVVPRPPMIIMPMYRIEFAKVKLSVLIKRIQCANNDPAIPAKKQPVKKASSL